MKLEALHEGWGKKAGAVGVGALTALAMLYGGGGDKPVPTPTQLMQQAEQGMGAEALKNLQALNAKYGAKRVNDFRLKYGIRATLDAAAVGELPN